MSLRLIFIRLPERQLDRISDQLIPQASHDFRIPSNKLNRLLELIFHALAFAMPRRPKLKIGWIVVHPVTILVVDGFLRKELPSDFTFHHSTMFTHLNTINGHVPVSVFIHPTIALVNGFGHDMGGTASARTEDPTTLPTFSILATTALDGNPTLLALKSGS